MTVVELMEKAKESCERPSSVSLTAETTLSDIDCNTVEELSISHNFLGNIPNLLEFPQLKSFHIFRPISFHEFKKISLTNLETLYVNFENKEPVFCFSLPKIKHLSIYISNNTEDQLSMFEVSEFVVDISECSSLEKLELNHCTGAKIKCAPMLKLKKLICKDYRHSDFEFLKQSPNLTHLTITGCQLDSLDFLSSVPRLIDLNLSYNELQYADEVVSLANLKKLRLVKNPLANVSKYKSMPIETIVTDEDNEWESFKFSIQSCYSSAYRMLLQVRKADPKRPEIIQKAYDRQSDEEIFSNFFISYVKKSIEQATSSERIWQKYKCLTKQDMQEYIRREYPFCAHSV